MAATQYLSIATGLLEKIARTQTSQIHKAADQLTENIVSGHSIFSFGASHAFMVTEELVYRAGGLMLINPIYPHGMNLAVRPLTLTSQIERIIGLGKELLAQSPARQGDTLIITSNAGRNPVTIDMALHAREKGIHTIAITSLAYLEEKSRHPSGSKLAEICDLVIDNCVSHGDAVTEIPSFPQKVAPVSTIASCAIANAIVAETVERLVERGVPPPVFMSANLDGGDAHNERLLAQNRARIHYL